MPCPQALDTDSKEVVVSYRRLFDDDEDLNQGVFAEGLRQQHIRDRLDELQVCLSCGREQGCSRFQLGLVGEWVGLFVRMWVLVWMLACLGDG